MYVYVLVKEYYNNVAIVEQVFSSKKKAEEHLQWLIGICERDCWTARSGPDYYTWKHGDKVPMVELTSPSGRRESLGRFYILKERVA